MSDIGLVNNNYHMEMGIIGCRRDKGSATDVFLDTEDV